MRSSSHRVGLLAALALASLISLGPPTFSGPTQANTRQRRRLIPRRQQTASSPFVASGAPLPRQTQTTSGVRTLWDFTRPHTLIGTLISIPSLHLLAAAPALRAAAPAEQLGLVATLLGAVVWALVPALLVNLYITGINQIYDVDIDRQNKPDLPLPSGRLSLGNAWAIVLAALGGAGVLAWLCSTAGGQALFLPLALSALLGTAYSVPPLRMKRSPFLAAFCIVVVRGLVVNVGFYHYAIAAMGLAGSALDARCVVGAAFFAVFGLVIALMKDVPDVLGDASANIRSMSVRLGPQRVFQFAAGLLSALLVGTGAAFTVASFMSPDGQSAASRCLLALAALTGWALARQRQATVSPDNPKEVYSFYMFMWKLFYVAYFLLPLLQ